MGMFDTLTIDRDFKLPLPEDLQGIKLSEILLAEKQTKSFDCILEIFLLRANGVVYHCIPNTNFEREWVPYTKYVDMEFHTFIQGENKNAFISWVYNLVTKECSLVEYRVRDKQDCVHLRMLKKSKLLNKWYMRPYLWYRSAVRCIFRVWHANEHKIPKAWVIEAWLTPL